VLTKENFRLVPALHSSSHHNHTVSSTILSSFLHFGGNDDFHPVPHGPIFGSQFPPVISPLITSHPVAVHFDDSINLDSSPPK
jgi:hypothetical protein